MNPSTPELVRRYAERFDVVFSDGSHSVGSPLGGWLLLALVAPAATGTDRTALEAVLGTDADDACTRATELLTSPHPAVSSALAMWHRPEYVLPAFAGWSSMLPTATECGAVPPQSEADDWARRTSGGMIDRFPLELDEDTTIVLANALATRVKWSTPFSVAPGTRLGGEWGGRVERALRAPEPEHTVAIVTTDRAGDVGVHAARSDSGLMVVSAIADPGVAPEDVSAAAHDVALREVRGESRSNLDVQTTARHRSLFDLPLGDGHAWTIVERDVTSEHAATETFDAFLPAWHAEGDHDLHAAGDDLGFPAACRTLATFCIPSRRIEVEARQSATARFDLEGFAAAAITAMGIRSLGPPEPPRTITQRVATLRFNRPYAVVAVALAADGGAWNGVPVFSAWVAEPSEPETG